MRESPFLGTSAVFVVGGKIYMTQELENRSFHEEVFDIGSKTQKVSGVSVPDEEWSKMMMDKCVTLEGKLYAIDLSRMTVYNLRQGCQKEKLDMPINDRLWNICVADNLLFAFFTRCGLMWLDTRTNEWRAVIGDVQTLHHNLHGCEMAEHYGKLALF